MNREDIIRMAREAGFTDHNGFCEVIVRHSNGSWIGVKDELERFAALVAVAEQEKFSADLIEYGKAMAAAEREACARIAWNHEPDENGPIETAIRARSSNE